MIYSFGPFRLDSRSRALTRDGEPLPIPDRHFEVLLQLVSHPGQILSKDALIDAGWADVAVSENSLEQAISAIRRVLGPTGAGASYIDTVARRGYRFAAPVATQSGDFSPGELEALLAPHRSFVEGRTALETLGRDELARARRVFEQIIHVSPGYAPAHVGMANALALQFESTRGGGAPDVDALAAATREADTACRLDPASGEAWATLALVCYQSRDRDRAAAAARHAVSLEPDNWRHQVRLAYVSWGEARLRAAHRALQLLPGLALAHWLAASVHVARGAFAEAQRELVPGAAAQDRQRDGDRFKAAGLHLLLGMVRAATGDTEAALQEFERELASRDAAQIYTREACANAWCAIGSIRLQRGDTSGAIEAFGRAVDTLPGHPVALAARCALGDERESRSALDRRLHDLRARGAIVDAAYAEAVGDATAGRPERAARTLYAALADAAPGSDAWTATVDPALRASEHADIWAGVMTLLRNRAS